MLTENLVTIHSAAGLAIALSAIAVLALLPRLRHLRGRTLFAFTAGLLFFQVFHLLEHLIQLGYWFMHPGARPYMTPWAVEGARGLALWATLIPGDGTMMLRGMELLHLFGNFLFFAGLVGLNRLRTSSLPGLALALRIQALHLGEHVLLTLSVFVLGSPLGVSTLFGISEGTAWGGTVRVWFHFLINLAATVPAVLAWRSYTANRTREPQIHVSNNADQTTRTGAPESVASL